MRQTGIAIGDAMIKLASITKSYGKKQILTDVTLIVPRGRCVGLVGKNGSGKSTLLSIMAGALKADAGSIYYHDKIMATRKDLARYAAFVPQENPLIEELSVRDNLRLWYADSLTSIEDALKAGLPYEMGLGQILTEKVKNLSGGMKKRLSIACALANDAPVLLLDEPAASLDLVMKQDIISYLKRYLDRGGTVVISSHDRDELAMCDTLYHLKNGRLEEIPAGTEMEELVELITQ